MNLEIRTESCGQTDKTLARLLIEHPVILVNRNMLCLCRVCLRPGSSGQNLPRE